MKQYKMIDVVSEISERENCPSASDYDRFVGLEHYVSGEVVITKFGSTAKLDSAMKVFHSGDILVARRNVYLKRASVVFFDGLTSGDSIVLRAKDDRIARLLPFVLNTDAFWDYADQHSDGTMSKRLSPKTLLQYEFNLPDDDQQDYLADTLWAAVETKSSYQRLLTQTDELVKSQFIEMFGNRDLGWKYPTKKLHEFCKFTTGGTPANKDSKEYKGKIPWITTVALGKNYIYECDAIAFISERAIQDSATHLVPANSIMIGIRVGVGKSSINAVSMCTSQDVLSLYDIDHSFDLLYIKKVLDSYESHFELCKRGATIKGIPSDVVKNVDIPIVPYDTQKGFADFIEHSDKSKFELKQAIQSVNGLIKSLMQQDFSNSEKEGM